MPREYTWFLEPFDSSTNEAFSREIDENSSRREVPCLDGDRRDLWECPYPILAKFRRSRTQLHLNFQVWRQKGAGAVTLWPPVATKKKKRLAS